MQIVARNGWCSECYDWNDQVAYASFSLTHAKIEENVQNAY